MQIALLGLGRMGAPIASRLAERHPVRAFDIDSGRLDGAARSGLEVAGSAADAVAGADVLVTVLPGPIELEQAMTDALGRLRAGSLWVDLTSSDPRVTERLAARATERGVGMAAAPMGGGPAEARAGMLRFTLAAPGPQLAAARDLLTPLAAPGGITDVGSRPGDALVLKLLANLLWFGQVVAVTEAMLLGRSLGLDPELLRSRLAEGPGSGFVLQHDAERLLRGDYLADFGLDRVVEELGTITALAGENGTPFDLSNLVARLHAEALERFGPVDGELLAAKLLEERAGFTLRAGE
jgi:3-hydroxyisobutyrate dehydrogenase-like beta-hydroxyacid dehydrogenase